MNKQNKSETKSLLFAFIALFSWGIHGPAGRFLALQNVDMYFVTLARFWIGTAALGLFLVIRKKVSFSFPIRWKTLLPTAIIGVALNSFLYHLTLIYLPATLVMILENLSPMFVFLFTFILHKIKPTKFEVLSLVLAQVGVLFIVFGKSHFTNLHPLFLWGVFLGILTGATFGFYTFYSGELMRPYRKNPDIIIQNLFLVMLVSSILSLPMLFAVKSYPTTFSAWFWIAEMGIFQSGVSYLFWNYALAKLPANRVSILFLFTIFFTTINEILFLDLSLNLPLVLGGILIISSGILIQKK